MLNLRFFLKTFCKSGPSSQVTKGQPVPLGFLHAPVVGDSL